MPMGNLMTALKLQINKLSKIIWGTQEDLSRADIESNFIDELVHKGSQYFNDFVSTEHHELV